MASASQASRDVSMTKHTTPIVSGDNIRPHRATAAGRARNPDPMTRLKAMQHAAISETPSLQPFAVVELVALRQRRRVDGARSPLLAAAPPAEE